MPTKDLLSSPTKGRGAGSDGLTEESSSVTPQTSIHPTAIVHPAARLDQGVVIEPFAYIDGDVEIGAGSVIGSHVRIADGARLGREVKVHHGAVVGTVPQDLKFAGEKTLLHVGDRTVIREFATLNRGTLARGETKFGADGLIMAYAHVAHDCLIGDRVILANAVQLGGHVTIGDWVILGGAVVVHQFSMIGVHAMVGGGFRITQDVPPYAIVGGYPAKVISVNKIGLERRGFAPESVATLSRAFRVLFRSGLNHKQAVEKLKTDGLESVEITHLLEFITSSERGVMRG
jgi:UDP-N-acetylglucosamine acyltransferase